MKISRKAWLAYTEKLRRLNDKAAEEMRKWLEKHSLEDSDAMVEFAFQLVDRFGGASAALAAEMYDATVELAGLHLPAALPAEVATMAEVAEAVVGAAKLENPKLIGSAVGRLTKLAGVDTVITNAMRDNAEWAWIPFGETCAFCISLASRGWQRASKNALKKGHARHIHANCNCIYAVRFDTDSNVEGYDPEAYADLYYGSAAKNSAGRINDLRRRLYAENSEAINAQKREAYRLREERKKSKT